MGNPNEIAVMTPERRHLLDRLNERFSCVSYRSDGRFEIDKRILVTVVEAKALIGGQATLEEIVMYRNRPSHLIPVHVRLALGRTSP